VTEVASDDRVSGERQPNGRVLFLPEAAPPATNDVTVVAMLEDDLQAPRIVWHRFAPMVHRTLRRAFGPDYEIDDLVQEVFLVLFKYAHTQRERAASARVPSGRSGAEKFRRNGKSVGRKASTVPDRARTSLAVFSSDGPPPTVGRYVLHGEIASGGMATVHFGRLRGAAGFARSVAIKRLHPQYAKDPDFVARFVDEARIAGRIAHPNVVPTIDVVSQGDELLLVMEYVRGASFSHLLRALAQKKQLIPPRIAVSIVSGVLRGLHAAHEAKSEKGERLDIVHRDVSPQNMLVGTDGIARVLDFGVAKAQGRWQSTHKGQLKGKLPYMAPEQITTGLVTRKTDLYAAAVVLWEALTGRRLFRADNEAKLRTMVLEAEVQRPSELVDGLPRGFDALVMKGLQRDPGKRFATAREMASALEGVVAAASATEVGEWVETLAANELRDRANCIGQMERNSQLADSPSRDEPEVRASRTAAVSKDPDPRAPDVASSRRQAASPLVTTREPTSQVSRRAMVRTDAPRSSRNRWVVAAALAGAVCAVGTAGLVLRQRHPSTTDFPAAQSPVVTHVASSASTTAISGSSGAPILMATAIATTTATGPTTATQRATARPAVTRAARTADNSRQPTNPALSACDPPYTTDERRHVHFKPNCVN
jgi:serine/threonine protein kinase